MRKLLFFMLSILVLFCSCSQEQEFQFPTLKSIKSHDKYESVGVGSTSGSSKSSASNNYLIGNTYEGVIDKLSFYDKDGNTVDDVFVSAYRRLENYLFVSFGCSMSEETKYYCIYLPTMDLFDLSSGSHYWNVPNDMMFACNDAVFQIFNGVEKTYFEDGSLIIKQIIKPEISGFDFIFADKYGNVFSSDWNKGHLCTSNGKLINLPSTMSYRKGMDDIVYYELDDEKGYFDENGERKKINDGFYPSFIIPDLYSSYNRFYDLIKYVDGSDEYYFAYEQGGFYVFRGQICKISFNESGGYSEESIPLSKNLYPNNSKNDLIVRGYALVDKNLYVLASDRFFIIDMTTGLVVNIDDDYYDYKNLEYLRNGRFRILAIDQDMNRVVFEMDKEGKKTILESDVIQLNVTCLYPCN